MAPRERPRKVCQHHPDLGPISHTQYYRYHHDGKCLREPFPIDEQPEARDENANEGLDTDMEYSDPDQDVTDDDDASADSADLQDQTGDRGPGTLERSNSL